MYKCIGLCKVLHQRGEEKINIGFLIPVNAEESEFVANRIPPLTSSARLDNRVEDELEVLKYAKLS